MCTSVRSLMLPTAAALLLLLTLAPPASARTLSQAAPPARRVVAYVWTGSERDSAKDFVATIDVTHPDDPAFGTILSTVDAPYSDLEPHHISVSADGKVLAVGAFHGFLKPKKNIPSLHFFDVNTDPTKPRYLKGVQPTHGAVPDDWVRLPDGGFLVSLMGSKNGGTPGRIAELNANLTITAEYLPTGPDSRLGEFNPHGLWSLPGVDRLVSVDLFDYSQTLKPAKPEDIKYRSTARIWALSNRTLLKTVDLGAENTKGLMDVMQVGPPGTGGYVHLTAGKGWLWGLDTVTYELKKLLDLNRDGKATGHCVLSTPFKNGTRVLTSVFGTSRIFLLDTTNPRAPTILQEYKLPNNAGPHAIAVHPDANIVTVTDYYIQQDSKVGRIKYPQDRKLHFFRIAADGNSITPHERVPTIDFPAVYKQSRGGARPHGIFYKAWVTSTN